MAAAVVSIRLMTSLLSPAEVGRYTVVLALTGWFALTLISPIGNYFNRQLLWWVTTDAFWEACRRYLLLLLPIVLVSVAASLALEHAHIIDIGIQPRSYAAIIAGVLIFLTVNSMLIDFVNQLGSRIAYVLATSATLWLGLLASLILATHDHKTAESWIAGQVIGWALVGMVAVVLLRGIVRRAAARLERRVAVDQSLWAFAWPLVLSTSLYWFQIQGYRLVLVHWLDLAALGLLSTGLTLGTNPMAIVDTLLMEYLRPRYYQRIADGERLSQEAAWREVAGQVVGSLLPIAVFVGLSGPFLVVLLVGPRFHSVAGLVLWGAAFEYARAVNTLYVLAVHTSLRTRTTLKPNLVGALVTLVAIGPLTRWSVVNGPGLALTGGMWVATFLQGYSLRPYFTAAFPVRGFLRAGVASLPLIALAAIIRVNVHRPDALQSLLAVAGLGAATLATVVFLVWTLARAERRSPIAGQPDSVARL